MNQASQSDVTMTLDSVYQEPMVGLKVMVHHPLPPTSLGARKRCVGNHLVACCHHYCTGARRNNDKLCDWKKCDVTTKDGYYAQKFLMSSAIIGVPGAETGELLIGYPFTSVSTNQRTESMTVGLRVYLGAVLKQLENVIVLPDVHFEGCVTEKPEPVTVGADDKFNYDNVEYSKQKLGLWSDGTNNSGTTILGELDTLELCHLTSGLQVYRRRTQLTKAVAY